MIAQINIDSIDFIIYQIIAVNSFVY